MAETLVAKSTKASVDATTAMVAPQLTGLIAGETLEACQPIYIKASDGKVWKASGAAANAAADCVGISARQANAGEPVTVFSIGTVFKYSDGLMTPGLLYLGTGGTLSSTASVGDAVGMFRAVDANNVRVRTAI